MWFLTSPLGPRVPLAPCSGTTHPRSNSGLRPAHRTPSLARRGSQSPGERRKPAAVSLAALGSAARPPAPPADKGHLALTPCPPISTCLPGAAPEENPPPVNPQGAVHVPPTPPLSPHDTPELLLSQGPAVGWGPGRGFRGGAVCWEFAGCEGGTSTHVGAGGAQNQPAAAGALTCRVP